MKFSMIARISLACGLATSMLLVNAAVHAAEPVKDVKQPAAVDLFTAMKDGKVDVKFIPINATKANVIFENQTKQEMLLRLPETFGAVNAQGAGIGLGGGGMGGMGGGMGGMGGGMGGMGGGMGGMGGGQGMGGGFGGGMGGGMGGMGGMGGGMGGMGGGMMGGMMRVAPEKKRKVSVNTVCLEHGKPDPNPRMTYSIVPLEMVNTDPRVANVCRLLANGRVTQNVAQAAAWHFTDKMGWRELAMKNRVESQYTGNIRFFSPIELRQAMVVAAEAARVAEEAESDEERYASDTSEE